MSGWAEVWPRQAGDGRSRAPRVARVLVPLGIAAVLAALGRHLAAVLVVVAAGGLAIASTLSPRVERVVGIALHAAGRAVAWVFSTVLLGAVEVLVFAPFALVARLVGHDPLAGRQRGWWSRTAGSRPLASRSFGYDERATRRRGPVLRVARVAVQVVGLVLLALAMNYGLGWTWDEYVGSHEPPVAEGPPPGSVDALAAAPAGHAPWSRGYWAEFRSLEYEFLPYILSRVADTDRTHITSDDGVRGSYRAGDLGGDSAEVWFFGGGALWGQGQRDGHTIPSEIARLAEVAGEPVRVVNFGQPGYTSWQSALLLEQELAVRPTPDLVVFYDGADDVAVQVQRASTRPTHYNTYGTSEVLTGRDSASEHLGDLWDDYVERSVLHRALTNLGVIGMHSAGADTSGLADRVAELHGRSADLAQYLADREGVPVVFAWQAAEGVRGDGGAYREAAAESPGEDLSGVLDDEDDVYLDGVLTNERGAAIVASHLWPLLQPHLP